jgi:hypothetical protein
MGRILRNKPDGRPALAIDIVDQIAASTAPQVSMADIFTMPTIQSGHPIGATTEEYKEGMASAIDQLASDYSLIPKVDNIYTQYAALLETLPQLTRGQAQIKQEGKIRTFASSFRLAKRYYIDSFMLDHIRGDVETRQVRSGYEAVDAYDEQQIHERIALLPDSGLRGHGLTVGGKTYLGLSDLMSIAQRKYDSADISFAALELAVRSVITDDSDMYFTKRFRARTHKGVSLYTAQTMIELQKAQTVVAQLGAMLRTSGDI